MVAGFEITSIEEPSKLADALSRDLFVLGRVLIAGPQPAYRNQARRVCVEF